MANQDGAESALRHADDLLSGKWRPPLHSRIRWWNLALIGVVLTGAFAVIAPIFRPGYREGFRGNLVSSAWQLIAGSIIGYIVYKRFRAERFKRAMPISWAEPFTELDRISLNLYPNAIGEAVDLRNALTGDVRKKLVEVAHSALQKGILFGRYFEIEQIADIDESRGAAEELASLGDSTPDPIFMRKAIMAILTIHVSSSRVRGYSPSIPIRKSLLAAFERWSSL